ncbi:MAG: nuclear transport factor 2 family protein [Alphaproteobacteria bacterium]
MNSDVSLEARIRRLEDVEAIKRLIATYAIGADRQNDPAVLRQIYADDAIWEAEGMMKFEGADVLSRELHEFGKARIPWSLHYNTSPLVEVAEDGRTATMFWYVWEVANVTPEGGGTPAPSVVGGWYESWLRKFDDGWKFTHIKLFPKLFSPRNAPAWNLDPAD